mgnify:FL=1
MKEQKIDFKEMNKDNNQGEIVIYQTDDGDTKIDVRFVDETVWLTQAQLCELYQTSKSNVSEHIKNIFEEGELEENSTVRKFRTTASDGKNYNVSYYNLDMIISLGYRIKSITATQFRRWATERLKEYMIKGFTMDDERLKNLGGGNYWKELLDRIRDIRSSEKVMYRQVLAGVDQKKGYLTDTCLSAQDAFKKYLGYFIYRMKTENLTYGSSKAVREVFCNISCFRKERQAFIC